MCTPAPTCRRALAEARVLWPYRSRSSDGICASPEHSRRSPTSDHEVGNAFDLTYDPINGCDAHELVEHLMLRRDPRVKYIISKRRIWNPAISMNWREYGGANGHYRHAHVSIHWWARDSKDPWWNITLPPSPHREHKESVLLWL
jgi:hypothetical protein